LDETWSTMPFELKSAVSGIVYLFDWGGFQKPWREG
jgi:hypothetical protein